MTTAQFSSFGLVQNIVAKPDAPRSLLFHVTFYFFLTGALAFGLLYLLRAPLARWLDAPAAAAFLPGLVLAGLLDRVAANPMRVLFRDMRFRAVAVARAAGEVAFAGSAVLLAWRGWGGQAIVAGNVVRSLLVMAAMLGLADRRDWIEPARLNARETREVWGFGLPLWVSSLSDYAARNWDNLLFSRLFGPAVVGTYNLAYKLADLPATQIGEQIGDVLLPSFAHMTPERRRDALVRSTAILTLIMAPLAAGLGGVAHTLVAVAFPDTWAGIAPMLAILAGLSVVRPVGWTIASYLTACHEPRPLMVLAVARLALLLALIAALSPLGPLWSAGAVGLAYTLHALGSMVAVRRLDRIPVGSLLLDCSLPVLACGPLLGAVLAVRAGMEAAGLGGTLLGLVAEIAAGGAAYVVAALIVARRTSRELVRLVAEAVLRRRPRGDGG